MTSVGVTTIVDVYPRFTQPASLVYSLRGSQHIAFSYMTSIARFISEY